MKLNSTHLAPVRIGCKSSDPIFIRFCRSVQCVRCVVSRGCAVTVVSDVFKGNTVAGMFNVSLDIAVTIVSDVRIVIYRGGGRREGPSPGPQ